MANHAQRRLREKNELRLKILDAARELFATGGEENVTLRAVADKIEYSATTIYQHFTDKDALLRELCAADFFQFSRVLKQAERVADPVERLRKVAAGYVDFGLQHPGHYRLMFLPAVGHPAQARLADKKITAAKTEASAGLTPGTSGEETLADGPYSFLQGAVFKAMAAGCFRSEHRDVAAIAQLLWCGLHGVIALYLVRAKYPTVGWKPIDLMAVAMTDCLLAGLLEPRFAAALSA